MISEDVVAVIFLIVLSGITSTGMVTASEQLVRIVETGIGGVALMVLGYVVSTYLARYAINYFSSYDVDLQEIPFLFCPSPSASQSSYWPPFSDTHQESVHS